MTSEPQDVPGLRSSRGAHKISAYACGVAAPGGTCRTRCRPHLRQTRVVTRADLDKQPLDVARMFDDVASRYDVTNDMLVPRPGSPVASCGRRRSRAALPGERVLDLAAGTGTSSVPFAAQRKFRRPVRLLVGHAGGRHQRRPELAFVAGDAMRLPFADASFDAVTISFGLRNVHDPAERSEGDAASHVVPAGGWWSASSATRRGQPFRQVYTEYLMRALPSVAHVRCRATPRRTCTWPSRFDSGRPTRVWRRSSREPGWSEVAWRDLSGGIVALHRASATPITGAPALIVVPSLTAPRQLSPLSAFRAGAIDCGGARESFHKVRLAAAVEPASRPGPRAPDPPDRSADVIVVGAGPAGSTTAYHLAQAGLDVLLLEKTTFPREKVCGDGLTPRAVKQLLAMGIDPDPADGWVRNHGLRIIGGGMRLELPWPDLASYPDYGLVRTREDFDEILARHAQKAGARLHESTAVTGPVLDHSDASLVSLLGLREPDGGQRRRGRVHARRWSWRRTATRPGSRSRWAFASGMTDPWVWPSARITRVPGTTTTGSSRGLSSGTATGSFPATAGSSASVTDA